MNYESYNDISDFINTVVSHYLLRYILHPTGVIDHSTTVIDNMFSNNTSHKTVSGNIIISITDHSPQFIIRNKISIDYKSCSYGKRDFLNFDEQKFHLLDPSVSIDSKFDQFYLSLSSYVDHHVPVKKMNKKDLKLHSKPWIAPKIYYLDKYRDKLLCKLNKKFSNSMNTLKRNLGTKLLVN